MPEEETFEEIKDSILFKKEVEIAITPQAVKILRKSNVPVEDFLNWCLVENKISFGGHNVMLFLEREYDKKTVKKAPTGA